MNSSLKRTTLIISLFWIFYSGMMLFYFKEEHRVLDFIYGILTAAVFIQCGKYIAYYKQRKK